MTQRGASRFLFVVALVILILFFLVQLFRVPTMIIILLFPYTFEGKVTAGYLFFGCCLSGILAFYWLVWLGYDSFRHSNLITTGAIWVVYGSGHLFLSICSRTPLSWIIELLVMVPGVLVVIAGAFIWKPEKLTT
ncbi:MAG: hypothetical protein ACFFDU_00830 [Candidatus Thorarchaeota archaeon]